MNLVSLNNFQRQETVKWLLSMSQAAAVGGPASYFVPGVGERVGVIGVIETIMLAIVLFLVAMSLGRKVKNVN